MVGYGWVGRWGGEKEQRVKNGAEEVARNKNG